MNAAALEAARDKANAWAISPIYWVTSRARGTVVQRGVGMKLAILLLLLAACRGVLCDDRNDCQCPRRKLTDSYCSLRLWLFSLL